MRFFSEQNSPQKTRRRKEFCGCNQKYESCSDDRNREAGQETLRDPERVQQDSPGRQPLEHPRRLDRALQGRSDLRRPFRAEPSFPCLTPGLTPWAVLFRPFRVCALIISWLWSKVEHPLKTVQLDGRGDEVFQKLREIIDRKGFSKLEEMREPRNSHGRCRAGFQKVSSVGLGLGATHKLQPQTTVKMFIGAAEEYQIGVGTSSGVLGSILGSQLLGTGGGNSWAEADIRGRTGCVYRDVHFVRAAYCLLRVPVFVRSRLENGR